MQEAEIVPLDAERFGGIVPEAASRAFAEALARGRRALSGRTVWHVNSTATGGGVAEILQTTLGYLTGAGIDVRWLVAEGSEEFFVVTKRLHHMLHDRPGDGPLGAAERDVYLAALRAETPALLERVGPGDVVFLHDPQTLALADPLREAGARVVWTCHVGVDRPGEVARAAWRFLLAHTRFCQALVFTRPQYIWEGLERDRVEIVPPCIDAFSPKNQRLEDAVVRAILARAAVVDDGAADAVPAFNRLDGSPASVRVPVRMFEDAPVPFDAPIVSQVSRWDRLKDHRGVMTAFAEHVTDGRGAHLVLAGPSPAGVDDDPESAAVLDELVYAREQLAESARRRVHVACLPMDDLDENAAVVNALQRRSAVVVQKSLAEGFGLTVAEAMWKARPVAATRVGGIQDQIEHGRTGVLVDDPADLGALGRALTSLLHDPPAAERLGRAAHESVAKQFLAPRYLAAELRLAVRTL